MSGVKFATKTVSFTPFVFANKINRSALANHLQAKKAAANLETGVGISGPLSAFDPVTEASIDTPVSEGCSFCVVNVVKEAPSSLIKAECQLEYKAMKEATGVEQLSRNDRIEIKKSVSERLNASAQCAFKSTEVFIDIRRGLLLIGASSVAAIDRVFINLAPFISAAPLFSVGPEINDWSPVSFHPKASIGELFTTMEWIVPEFIMWLWYGCIAGGLMCELDPSAPVIFMGRGEDTEGGEVRLSHSRRSVYTNEAVQAVQSGKLLTRATFLYGNEDSGACFTLSASGHLAVKVSTDSSIGHDERFVGHYSIVIDLLEWLENLFDRFKKERATAQFTSDMCKIAENHHYLGR